MTGLRPPRDNIVRAMPSDSALTEDGGLGTLTGHFAVFNEWTRIDSAFEGTFMERLAPGAFKKTFAEKRDGIRVLFQHGQDPQVGDKPLGPIRSLVEDARGASYEVPLLDTSYNRDLLPGLREGLYGASFRFRVTKEDVEQTPTRSASNPDGLPERTIREAEVFEFGPVTFPAYAGATAGMRSMTDTYIRGLLPALHEPEPAPATPEPEPPPPIPEPSGDIPVEYISREDKASRVTELEAALKRTSTEYPGVLPVEVQATYDADKDELRQLRKDIEAWDERQAFIRSLEHDEDRQERISVPTVIRTKSPDDIYDLRAVQDLPMEKRTQTIRDNAMRSIEGSYLPKIANVDALASFIDHRDSEDQEAARRVLLTGSPAYKRAFAKYLKDGNERGFTPEESRAAALAVTGTTTTGGYAVPYVFDPTLINIGVHTSANPYRAACRVETITGGNNWRAVTASAITAKWDAEAAASVEGGPTIGQPTFTVQRADAFATVSIETLQDRPDITDELSGLFAEAKDNLEENSFTLGAGTTVYPQGMFLSGAFTVISTATNDTTVISDLLLLEAGLPLRHRANAAFFMSRSTQRQFEVLDTTGYYFKRVGQNFAAGSAIPQNSATGNTGSQLLGYPIWEVPSAVSTFTVDQAVIVVFGDPRNYVVVDRIGMNVEVVPTMLNGATPSFPTGQRGIYCYWRATARALNVDGMRQLDVN